MQSLLLLVDRVSTWLGQLFAWLIVSLTLMISWEVFSRYVLNSPHDWALEIGLLAEVFRNSAPRAICQSELCDNYDHKHQDLSARDPEKGLNKMAVDISKSFFRQLAAGLVTFLWLFAQRPGHDTRQRGRHLGTQRAHIGRGCPGDVVHQLAH